MLGGCTCASADAIGEQLAAQGLGEFADSLREQGFDTIELLAAASPEVLKVAGMNMKQRKKLVHAIRQTVHNDAHRPQASAAKPDDENWSTVPSQLDWNDCSIDSVPAAELTLDVFEQRYRERAPVRIVNLTRHLGWPANERWRKQPLLSAFGDRTIVADTMYDKSVKLGYDPSTATTLREYVQSFGNQSIMQQRQQQPQETGVRPKRKNTKRDIEMNIQQYVFDGSFMEVHAPELRQDFGEIPAFAELARSSQKPVPYWFCGPADSGLWFHRHGRRWPTTSVALPANLSEMCIFL
eukprot:COSAG02_NODE_1352_length_13107_cov_1461.050584_10_plen_296_part_00